MQLSTRLYDDCLRKLLAAASLGFPEVLAELLAARGRHFEPCLLRPLASKLLQQKAMSQTALTANSKEV